jgi:tetratricopeptide (TPR) repeat protein
MASTVLAQSSRYQARRWFSLGLREKNIAKKIDAMGRAVLYDSLFTDALYQLGQLYVQQKDYALAESFLSKACTSVMDSTKNARKAQILYELAVARKTLGKLQEAETALREAKSLAHDQKLQVLSAFELGLILYRQNRYAEAFVEWQQEIETRGDSAESDAKKMFADEMRSIYTRAQRYCADGEFEKAVAVYDSLLQYTGALDVAARFVKADTDFKMAWPLSAAMKSRRHDNSLVYIGGAFAALIVLPLLGFVFFSSTSRIAYYRWRKNYLAAARTFEKLLERHPQKINLYAPLAELYLRLRRHDERALKIYKTVLQLNLATRKRDEINAIVAQKYLAEGRTDSDVIEVLENALRAESRRQSLSLKAAN